MLRVCSSIETSSSSRSTGACFGNEGRSHNYHFTLEASTEFRYIGGEIFRFSGDDDMWVFINRRLAIDLGGLHQAQTETVELDAHAAELGITRGETYPLHFLRRAPHGRVTVRDRDLDCRTRLVRLTHRGRRKRPAAAFVGLGARRIVGVDARLEEVHQLGASRLGIGATEIDQPAREAAVEQQIAREIRVLGDADVEQLEQLRGERRPGAEFALADVLCGELADALGRPHHEAC